MYLSCCFAVYVKNIYWYIYVFCPILQFFANIWKLFRHNFSSLDDRWVSEPSTEFSFLISHMRLTFILIFRIFYISYIPEEKFKHDCILFDSFDRLWWVICLLFLRHFKLGLSNILFMALYMVKADNNINSKLIRMDEVHLD